MPYQLFHNEISTFDITQTAFRPNPTAIVEAATLSEVFRLTNHIDSSWYNNPGVTPCLRSTSVGDLIVDPTGDRYLVASFGFQPQPAPPQRQAILSQLQLLLERRALDAQHVPTLIGAYQLLLSEPLPF